MKSFLDLTGNIFMSIRLYLRIIYLVFFLIGTFSMGVYAENDSTNADQRKVVGVVKNARAFIKKEGREKAIAEFKKNSSDIFVIDYNGITLASPLHPEMIGTNQVNYRDPSGVLVVREEIEKAKAGGGWLKGRWRKNSKTGTYQCRKIYILPMPGDYFIGSWYHYPAKKQGNCLI